MKRFVCVFLAFALVFAAFAPAAFALVGGSVGSLSYSYDPKTVTLCISGEGELTREGIDALPKWETFRKNAKTLIVEDGVTGICLQAFLNFENLETLELPTHPVAIGKDAFLGSALYEKNKSKTLYVGSHLLWVVTSRSTFEIKDGTTDVAEYAFRDVESLTTLKVPSTLALVAQNAFLKTSVGSVDYDGTSEDFAKIDVRSGNDSLFAATKIFKAAHEHTYELASTSGDCLTGIKYTYVCSECGNTDERTETFDSHDFGEIAGASDASCRGDGYTGDRTCARCGFVQKGEVIPAKAHSYGDWIVTKLANCISEGEETRTCSQCGFTQTRKTSVDSSVHVNTETVGAKEAKCLEDGYSGDLCCLDCGAVVLRGHIVGKIGHDESGGIIVTKEATCCNAGDGYVICKRCGERRTVIVLEGDKHEGGTRVEGAVAPGCVTPGYSGDVYCLGCGELIERGMEIAPIGHRFAETGGVYVCECGETSEPAAEEHTEPEPQPTEESSSSVEEPSGETASEPASEEASSEGTGEPASEESSNDGTGEPASENASSAGTGEPASGEPSSSGLSEPVSEETPSGEPSSEEATEPARAEPTGDDLAEESPSTEEPSGVTPEAPATAETPTVVDEPTTEESVNPVTEPSETEPAASAETEPASDKPSVPASKPDSTEKAEPDTDEPPSSHTEPTTGQQGEKPTEPAVSEPSTEKPAEPSSAKPDESSTKKQDESTSEPITVTKGDVDKNGRITAYDARLALRISAKLEKADNYRHSAADVDENGIVTAYDARRILRYSAKLTARL